MILSLLAAASTVAGGRLGGGAPLEVPVLRILAALALCLMVATLVLLLLRRWGSGGGGGTQWLSRLSPAPRAIDVVEVRRLGLHADIGLVRHAGAEYLLLLQGGSATVLDTKRAGPDA